MVRLLHFPVLPHLVAHEVPQRPRSPPMHDAQFAGGVHQGPVHELLHPAQGLVRRQAPDVELVLEGVELVQGVHADAFFASAR